MGLGIRDDWNSSQGSSSMSIDVGSELQARSRLAFYHCFFLSLFDLFSFIAQITRFCRGFCLNPSPVGEHAFEKEKYCRIALGYWEGNCFSKNHFTDRSFLNSAAISSFFTAHQTWFEYIMKHRCPYASGNGGVICTTCITLGLSRSFGRHRYENWQRSCRKVRSKRACRIKINDASFECALGTGLARESMSGDFECPWESNKCYGRMVGYD